MMLRVISYNVGCFDNQEDGVNITANSLHPGVIATNLFRHNTSLADDNPIRGFTF